MKKNRKKSSKNVSKIIKFDGCFAEDLINQIDKLGKKHNLNFDDAMSITFAMMITISDDTFCTHQTDEMIQFIRNNIN